MESNSNALPPQPPAGELDSAGCAAVPGSLSFVAAMPTREGGYWMTCMENEHEKEWVTVFERNGTLMADLDLGIYDLRSIHNGLADVKWAHAISAENACALAQPGAQDSLNTTTDL